MSANNSGHEDAASKAHAASGARPITREDEGQVRAALPPRTGREIGLSWTSDGKLRAIDGCPHHDPAWLPSVTNESARAGIVPGPEGWCWAAAPARIENWDECIGCSHGLSAHDRSGGGCIYCNCPAFVAATPEKPHSYQSACAACRAGASHVEEPKAPPVWLTAAVLAALPVDGTPVDRNSAFHTAIDAAAFSAGAEWTLGTLDAALDAMTASGEIEYVGDGRWRRWGVPEGWHLVSDDADVLLMQDDTNPGTERATMSDDGTWKLWAKGWSDAVLEHGTATPPTLAAARTAALRACWERGVFGARPDAAPSVILDAATQPAGMAEQRAIVAAIIEDRPSQLRAALLTVLSRGPVEGLARLLPALDAAMGEAPGVARVTGAEARQAAREVGAEVDGARWSLPAMVPGWGWRLSYVPRCWFLTRLDAEDVEGGSVATVESEHGAWGWQLAGAPAWSEADSLAYGQSAALDAARRAGLFAPRSAPAPAAGEVSSNGGSSVMPVITAKDGSPIVYPAPHGPLDAAVLAILATASPAEITAHLAAWGAALVEQARASVEALPEIKAMRSPRVTIEGPTLREYADDGKTVVHEERVGSEDSDDAIDPAWAELETRVDRAERASAEAKLEAEAAAVARDTLARDYAAERALSESLRAQLDEAETARDDARAALSDLRAALADLAARWAGGAA